MHACVFGATGETGRRIVQQLKLRQISLRALVRNEARAREILPEGVELIVGDLAQPEAMRRTMEGCNVLVCATGARPSWDPSEPYRVDFEGTCRLVDLAKAQGIEHFVLISSLCVSQFFHPLNLFWLILVWKKRAEEYLQQSGLVYTIVRPGGLKNEDNPDGIVIQGPDQLFEGSIPRTKVAEVAVEALFQPLAHHRVVEIVARPDQPVKQGAELFAQIGGA